jgi:hypothetical protein
MKWVSDCLGGFDYSYSTVESAELVVDDERNILYLEADLVDVMVIMYLSPLFILIRTRDRLLNLCYC